MDVMIPTEPNGPNPIKSAEAIALERVTQRLAEVEAQLSQQATEAAGDGKANVIYKFDIQFPCMSTDSITCDLPISTEEERVTGAQIKEIAAEVVADGIAGLDRSIVGTITDEDWDAIAKEWGHKCDDFSSEWDDEQPLLFLHYTEIF
jgi:hypothetical protein